MKYLLYFFLFFFITFFFLALIASGTNSGLLEKGSNDDPVFVAYRSGGGRDIYHDGDRYGHKIEITFNGNYTLYRLIYHGQPGNSKISEKEIQCGSLQKNEFESLKACIQGSEFFDLPEKLPEASPRDVEFRAPARRIEMSIRPSQGEKSVTVTAQMGADREHYPEDFLKIHSELNEICRALLEHYHSEE